MSLSRRNPRRDAAEKAIVAGLKAVGAIVIKHSGTGEPDLFVRFRGRWTALEVKSGKGRRTPSQQTTTYPIVRTLDEALIAVGLWEGDTRSKDWRAVIDLVTRATQKPTT